MNENNEYNNKLKFKLDLHLPEIVCLKIYV